MFEDSVVFREGEQFKLFRGSWVTYKDWYDFTQFVLDSIQREQLYFNLDQFEYDPEKAIELLDYEDTYYRERDGEYVPIDPYDVSTNRTRF